MSIQPSAQLRNRPLSRSFFLDFFKRILPKIFYTNLTHEVAQEVSKTLKADLAKLYDHELNCSKQIVASVDAFQMDLHAFENKINTLKQTFRFFKTDDRNKFNSLFKNARNGGRTLISEDRFFVLWQCIENVKRLSGELCESGVYKGGSSYFIYLANEHLAGESQNLYSIDTFVGHIDNITPQKDNFHQPGMFSNNSYEDVKAFLAKLTKIDVIKEPFSPEIKALQGKKFKFVHLDMDIYDPTLVALKFFTNHMSPGGIIVVDDFDAPKCDGIRHAVDEFLSLDNSFDVWNFRTEQVVLVKRA